MSDTRELLDNRALDGVRSLERELLLLRAMNANPNMSVSQIGCQIDLPRSTVYRLLDTLRALDSMLLGMVWSTPGGLMPLTASLSGPVRSGGDRVLCCVSIFESSPR